MPIHSAVWQPFHAPLIAFAVAIALACAGRFLRIALLAAMAGGGGALAGWFAVTGPLRLSLPVLSLDEITTLAAAALLIGFVFTWQGSDRYAWLAGPVAALVTAWLLIGAPARLTALHADWPTALGIIVAVLLFVRALAESIDPVRLGLAGFTLAVAFHVAGAPPAWTQLALVPGLAGLAMFAAPSSPATAALPIAVDIAGLGCLAVIDLGRMRRFGFSAVDAAALSPLLALLLSPRTTERMGRLGGLAALAGALLAGAIAVGCVWLVHLVR